MLYFSNLTTENLFYSEIATLITVLLLAVFFDIKSRRIPNTLVLIGFIALLISQWWHQSLHLESLLIGLVVGLTLWKLRFIGGGDSKLLILVSAAFAPTQLLTLYLCISLAGGLQAVIALVLKHDKKLPYAVAITGGTMVFVSLCCSLLLFT